MGFQNGVPKWGSQIERVATGIDEDFRQRFYLNCFFLPKKSVRLTSILKRIETIEHPKNLHKKKSAGRCCCIHHAPASLCDHGHHKGQGSYEIRKDRACPCVMV